MKIKNKEKKTKERLWGLGGFLGFILFWFCSWFVLVLGWLIDFVCLFLFSLFFVLFFMVICNPFGPACLCALNLQGGVHL